MQQQAETFPVGVSPGVLPLNETGGKLTYRVIVTNIAEGVVSAALPPPHCGCFKKRKGLSAPAVCIDMNLFPIPPIKKNNTGIR